MTSWFVWPRSPQRSADHVVPRRFQFSKPAFFSMSHQASVLRQPTSPPPPCPASSRPSSTASPASRISPTDTRPWRRCTPTACRPTPPRAPRQPTPCSRPSPGCSSTQVWPPGASVCSRVSQYVAGLSHPSEGVDLPPLDGCCSASRGKVHHRSSRFI